MNRIKTEGLLYLETLEHLSTKIYLIDEIILPDINIVVSLVFIHIWTNFILEWKSLEGLIEL